MRRKRRRAIRPIGKRHDFDLGDLRAFIAVLYTGGATPAARALDVAQSNISMRIARLERLLAVQLFVREARSMRPSAAANRIRNKVLRILRLIDSLG